MMLLHVVFGALGALGAYLVLAGFAFRRPVGPHPYLFALLPLVLAPTDIGYLTSMGVFWTSAIGASTLYVLLVEGSPRGQTGARILANMPSNDRWLVEVLRYCALILVLPILAVGRVRDQDPVPKKRWTAGDELPTVCPKCKSPYWNRPRRT